MKLEAREFFTALTVLDKMDLGSSGESELFFKIYNGMVDVFGLSENMEVKVKLNVSDIDNISSCNIAVDKKSMLDIVRRIGKEIKYVLLEIDNDSVTIRTDGGIFSLEILRYVRDIPFVSGSVCLRRIYAKDLVGALSSVIHVATNVIYIVYDRCVYAYDDYRLARYEIKVPGIPIKGVCISMDAAKFIVDTLNILKEKIVEVGIVGEMIEVKVGGFIIKVRCKDLLKSIPDPIWALNCNYKVAVFVDKISFIDVLRQMEERESKYVYVEADSDIFFSIKMRSCDDSGDLGLPIEIPARYDYNGDGGSFRGVFNVQHLIESIEQVKGNVVALYCPDDIDDDNNWIKVYDYKYQVVLMGVVLEQKVGKENQKGVCCIRNNFAHRLKEYVDCVKNE
jgi:DNA polymerase III sliding clamp (beta) subunit (PCNA family)